MNLSGLANVVQILGVLAAIAAAIVAYRQWKLDRLFKRSSAIRDIIRGMHGNPGTNKFLHDIDYDVKWYDENFHNSEKERAVDVALLDLNYICYMFRMGLIQEDELNMARYELCRCLQNAQVQNYLEYINGFAKGGGMESPFAELIRYGMEKNLLNEKVFNK